MFFFFKSVKLTDEIKADVHSTLVVLMLNNSRDTHANIPFHKLKSSVSNAKNIITRMLFQKYIQGLFLFPPLLTSLKRLMNYLIIFYCDESLWRQFTLVEMPHASHDQRFRMIIRLAKSEKKVKSSISKDANRSRFMGSCSQRISRYRPTGTVNFHIKRLETSAIKLFGNKT